MYSTVHFQFYEVAAVVKMQDQRCGSLSYEERRPGFVIYVLFQGFVIYVLFQVACTFVGQGGQRVQGRHAVASICHFGTYLTMTVKYHVNIYCCFIQMFLYEGLSRGGLSPFLAQDTYRQYTEGSVRQSGYSLRIILIRLNMMQGEAQRNRHLSHSLPMIGLGFSMKTQHSILHASTRFEGCRSTLPMRRTDKSCRMPNVCASGPLKTSRGVSDLIQKHICYGTTAT